MSFRPDFLLLFVAALAAAGCRRDMYHQPKDPPMRQTDFFPDGSSARPPVPGTVARGHLDEDDQLQTGKIGPVLAETYPFPITREVLQRGRQRYDIYCAVCHGRTGDGDGMIVQRGFPAPPSYHIDRLRNAPAGHFVDVIDHGYGVMYSYASRVEPHDRWAIAAYIRALQLSHHATIQDVPASELPKLEAASR